MGAAGVVLSSKDILDEQGGVDSLELAQLVSLRPAVEYWALEIPLGWSDLSSDGFRPRMEALGICCAVLGIEWLALWGSFCPPPSSLPAVSGELDYLAWFLSCSGIGLALHPCFPLGIGGDVVGYPAFGGFLSSLDKKVCWWASGVNLTVVPEKLQARLGAAVIGFPIRGPLDLQGEGFGKNPDLPLVLAGG